MYAGWGETFIGFLRAFSCTKVTYLSEVFHARNNDKVPGNLHIYQLKKNNKKLEWMSFLFQRWEIPQFLGRSILSFCP